jgi:hypothetical protein
MLIGRVTMTANARRSFAVSFPWLSSTETLLGATVTSNNDLFKVYNVAVEQDGTRVSYQASGNGQVANGDEYMLTIQVQTSENQLNDDCIIYTIDCGGCC